MSQMIDALARAKVISEEVAEREKKKKLSQTIFNERKKHQLTKRKTVKPYKKKTTAKDLIEAQELLKKQWQKMKGLKEE
jgi:hypothetical protein